MILRIWHIFFFLLFYISAVFSQESIENAEKTTVTDTDVQLIEFSLDLVTPTGIFGNNIDGSIGGFSVRYLNQTKSKSYSMLGVQISYTHIGGLSATIQDFVDFNNDTRSNFISAEFIYRNYLPYYNKFMEPFVEFGIGPQFHYTSTNSTLFDEAGTTDFFFDATDFGFVAHLDIGTTIKVWNTIFVVLKASYYNGVAVTYDVPMEEVVTEFPIDSFNQFTSQTNHFRFHFGIAYGF